MLKSTSSYLHLPSDPNHHPNPAQRCSQRSCFFIDKATRYLRSRIPPKPVSKPTLSSLPVEVFFHLFPHLNVVDQACLLLTCKPFYFCFCHFLEHEELRFPRLYQLRLQPCPPRPEQSTSSNNSNNNNNNKGNPKFGHARTDLLRRLQKQDPKVKYCVKCLVLHRRDAFATDPSYHGPVFYRSYCSPDAGIVDICPCIALSVAGRESIVRALESLQKGNGAEGVFFAGKLGRAFAPVVTGRNGGVAGGERNGEMRPRVRLVHECGVGGCAFLGVKMRTVFYIDCGGCGGGGAGKCIRRRGRDVLVAETEYVVSSDSRVMDWRPTEAFRDPLYNILWAMRTAERGALLDQGLSGGGNKMREDRLSVKRNLGSVNSLVDGHWGREERMMSLSYLRLMQYVSLL